MGTTPIYGFPYPDPSDLVANYPALGQQLAEDIEDVLPTLGGLAPITTQSFTGQSSVSVNTCFTSTYDVYMVNIELANPAGASGPLRFRFRNAASDRTDSTYTNAIGRYQSNNSFAGDGANEAQNNAILTAGLVPSAYTYLTMHVVTPAISGKHSLIYLGGYWTSTATAIVNALVGAVTYATANSNDGFTIYPNSGTITGNLRIYGFKN